MLAYFTCVAIVASYMYIRMHSECGCTRNAFEMTTCTECFCHRKFTVAAAYNFSVHVPQRIIATPP